MVRCQHPRGTGDACAEATEARSAGRSPAVENALLTVVSCLEGAEKRQVPRDSVLGGRGERPGGTGGFGVDGDPLPCVALGRRVGLPGGPCRRDGSWLAEGLESVAPGAGDFPAAECRQAERLWLGCRGSPRPHLSAFAEGTDVAPDCGGGRRGLHPPPVGWGPWRSYFTGRGRGDRYRLARPRDLSCLRVMGVQRRVLLAVGAAHVSHERCRRKELKHVSRIALRNRARAPARVRV